MTKVLNPNLYITSTTLSEIKDILGDSPEFIRIRDWFFSTDYDSHADKIPLTEVLRLTNYRTIINLLVVLGSESLLRTIAVDISRLVTSRIKDKHVLNVVSTAEAFALGLATIEELNEARKLSEKSCDDIRKVAPSSLSECHWSAHQTSETKASSALRDATWPVEKNLEGAAIHLGNVLLKYITDTSRNVD